MLILVLLPMLLMGFASVWIARKVTRSRRHFGPFAVCAQAVLAALLGLVLISTTYPCSRCVPVTPGCRVVTIGIPFPQQHADRDPEPVRIFDVCHLSSEESPASVVGNFALGVLGLPLFIAFLTPKPPRARTG